MCLLDRDLRENSLRWKKLYVEKHSYGRFEDGWDEEGKGSLYKE